MINAWREGMSEGGMDGWTKGWMDMNGWTEGWMDDGWMDGKGHQRWEWR